MCLMDDGQQIGLDFVLLDENRSDLWGIAQQRHKW